MFRRQDFISRFLIDIEFISQICETQVSRAAIWCLHANSDDQPA